MKKLKNGSSFVEVILGIIFISILTTIISNTSNLFVLDTNTMIHSEVNMLTNSYINKAKIECKNVSGDLATLDAPIVENDLPFMNNNKFNVSYSCYKDTLNTTNNNHLYNINVDIQYFVNGGGYTKNAASYIYK